MDYMRETVYLLELRDLCDGLERHLEDFRQAAAEWTAYHAEMDEIQSSGARDPEHRFTELGAFAIRAQGNMWVALEAFLATWTRASLMLFPSPRGTAAVRERANRRGEYLTQLLAIPSGSLLEDRGLRDFWTHFDEKLDAALEEHGPVQRQRFESSREGPGRALRAIGPEVRTVTIGDGRTYNLDDLQEAVRALAQAVQGALASAGDRHREELLRGT